MSSQEEIKKAEELQGKAIDGYTDEQLNPAKNPAVITLMQQEDGNWKAFGQKNGKFHEIRAVKPEDALVELLTQS